MRVSTGECTHVLKLERNGLIPLDSIQWTQIKICSNELFTQVTLQCSHLLEDRIHLTTFHTSNIPRRGNGAMASLGDSPPMLQTGSTFRMKTP